jgi:hypothetical protein
VFAHDPTESEYDRELDGVDVDLPEALEDWLGGVLKRFDCEIRTPFLSAVLRELHECVEDGTMAALCAIDRVLWCVNGLWCSEGAARVRRALARWDSIKALRCRSQAYNDDKDKDRKCRARAGRQRKQITSTTAR